MHPSRALEGLELARQASCAQPAPDSALQLRGMRGAGRSGGQTSARGPSASQPPALSLRAGKEGSGMPGTGKPGMTPSAGLTQCDRGFILWADTVKTNLHFCPWT